MATPYITSPSGPSGTRTVPARAHPGGSNPRPPVAAPRQTGYNPTSSPTTVVAPGLQVGHTVNDERQRLRNLGYNVDKTGGYTARLHSAFMHAQNAGTYGARQSVGGRYVVPKAVHDWNAQNGIKPAGQKKTATTAPGTTNPYGNSKTPDTSNIPGAMTPDQIAAIIKQYSGKFNANTPQLTAPTFDPVAYAKNQAEAQFGPVIAQLTHNAAMMTGSESGAQQNISDYYAPVQQDAKDAVGSDDAFNAANVAAQQENTSTGITGGALQGAAAYGAAKVGSNLSGLAGDLGVNQHAADTGRVTSSARDEAQAHVTQGAMDANTLADIRQQLVGARMSQGDAIKTGTVDAQSRKQAELGNYINEQGTIQNQKILAADAPYDILAKQLGIQGTNQGIARNKLGAQTGAQQANDAHIEAGGTIAQQKANLWLTLHPKSPKTGVHGLAAWNDVNPGDKQALLDGMHQRGNMSRLSPQAAYKQLTADVEAQGYQKNTPKAKGMLKYIQNYVANTWGVGQSKNKYWSYDPKTDSFVLNKAAKVADKTASSAAKAAAQKKLKDATNKIFNPHNP